jgi:TPP-dependent pyruvate/acetoin dehydrogenase alpha subunit
MTFSNTYEKIFFDSLRIRLVEEKIIGIYPTDKIQSPVHLSIGQEAVAAGVCHNLTKEDLLYTSYRSHAYYLAKGGSLKKMFAELYGKIDGCARGKGGSMHLADKEVGFMGASAVVGNTISHAVGSAMASKYYNRKQIAVATFGDGATEEGTYHESLNFASAFQLPVLFICENNELAIHSKIESRHSYKITEHAKTYGIKSILIEEGYDFDLIEQKLKNIIELVRTTQLPYLAEIKTYRYKEHVGISDDHNMKYRSPEDYNRWKQKDPLINDKTLFNKFYPVIQREIEEAVLFAESSPFPDANELLNHVY